MAAARAIRTNAISLQDSLERLDNEGFDLLQVLAHEGDLIVIGVPQEHMLSTVLRVVDSVGEHSP